MSEWWTYRLSDFLLFSSRTYYRLFELYNGAIWPLQVVALALGAAILFLLYRGGPLQGRRIVTILAVGWLWVAGAFHLERYATINWAAPWFAAAFAVQALLLLWTGVVRDRLAFQPTRGIVDSAGFGIFLFALMFQPLIGPLQGRAWSQVGIFGIAPDPTALATLGLLLATERTAWVLLVIPVAWCLASGATLWAMDSPDAFVMPLLAVAGLASGVWKARRRARAAVAESMARKA